MGIHHQRRSIHLLMGILCLSLSPSLLVVLVRADEGTGGSTNNPSQQQTYVPQNDVNSHSSIALDTLDITKLLLASTNTSTEEALDLYVNGLNRVNNSLQGMAEKDWEANGAPDTIKINYENVLGPDYLDSYTVDAINCNNTFEGKSKQVCQIAAMKNLLCIMLSYAQYEGSKAIASSSMKNWDEMFAFWFGVYNQSAENVGLGSPGYVQSSRDENFGTNFKQASLDAMNMGQEALDSDDQRKLIQAFASWNAANLATFAQAAVKYAYELEQPDANVDAKWTEGYSYFRCAAGLFNETFAKKVNDMYSVLDKDVPEKDLYCTIVRDMVETGDLGYGVEAGDLNLKTFIPSVESDCGVTIMQTKSSASEDVMAQSSAMAMASTTWILVLGMLAIYSFSHY